MDTERDYEIGVSEDKKYIRIRVLTDVTIDLVERFSRHAFEISNETNRRDFALDFFKQLRAKTEASGGPPPLGLHTLMQESAADKIKNMIENIAANYIAPVEVIARKI